MKSEQPKTEMMGKFEKYHVENAARTIKEAHGHMQDPELMKHVKKVMGKDMKAMKSAMGAMPDEGETSDNPGEEKIDSMAKLSKAKNKKFSSL